MECAKQHNNVKKVAKHVVEVLIVTPVKIDMNL